MKRRANYNTIHPERIIPEWPEEIRKRERIGDWEGDTLCGGEGKGGAVTLVDRKSGLICGWVDRIVVRPALHSSPPSAAQVFFGADPGQ